MNVLLDTNVVSEATRPRADPRVAEWLKSLADRQTFISVITVAELKRGVALMPSGRRRSDLADWVQVELVERYGDRLLALTAQIADVWGQLTADLQRAGTPMPTLDGFIAATALAHSLTVATRNVRDFERAGVTVFNPWNS